MYSTPSTRSGTDRELGCSHHNSECAAASSLGCRKNCNRNGARCHLATGVSQKSAGKDEIPPPAWSVSNSTRQLAMVSFATHSTITCDGSLAVTVQHSLRPRINLAAGRGASGPPARPEPLGHVHECR